MYRATVVSVDDEGLPSVEVPEFGTGYEFGPCQALVSGPWVRGDRVLVDSVAEILEDVIIVGRIDPEPGEGGGGDPDPDPGGEAGAFYEQTFAVPATVWLVPHGLGRLRPEVTLTDQSGDLMFGDISYDSTNQLRALFAFPTAGAVTVSV